MEKRYKTREKFSINLKQVPPLDPNKIKPSPIKERNPVEDVEGDKVSECDITEPHNLKVEHASAFGERECRQISTTRRKPTTKDRAVAVATASDDEGNGKRRGRAKSDLHEICAANKWKPPLFECCTEEGPCHLKMFTFKVTVEIREASSSTVLECFSAPQPRKKSAIDHAAEGTLWFLRHLGYFSKNSL
ncbi:hypothetical protein TIFTF001_019101 [Ficus carica]|uniref:DRBM domain-containing protein n=1 Tax=Ficus carica TaxID=3494 RepID=A0AA88AAZ9_FICCA|nr:hypothetical protein TIFTF001_019101 [Ficus carica]